MQSSYDGQNANSRRRYGGYDGNQDNVHQDSSINYLEPNKRRSQRGPPPNNIRSLGAENNSLGVQGTNSSTSNYVPSSYRAANDPQPRTYLPNKNYQDKGASHAGKTHLLKYLPPRGIGFPPPQPSTQISASNTNRLKSDQNKSLGDNE